jgi:hypothetical protein
MKHFRFVIITEIKEANDKDKEVFQQFNDLLNDGYEVVHAIATDHAVFYVIAKEIGEKSEPKMKPAKPNNPPGDVVRRVI